MRPVVQTPQDVISARTASIAMDEEHTEMENKP